MEDTLKKILIGALTLGSVSGCANPSRNPQDADLQARLECKVSAGIMNINGKELENGYINPCKLIFEVRDQDQNGKCELIALYKGQKYLAKYDSTSKRISFIPFEKQIKLIENK